MGAGAKLKSSVRIASVPSGRGISLAPLFYFLVSRTSPRPHPPPCLRLMQLCMTEPGGPPARENKQVRTGIRAELLAQCAWATHPLQNTVNNCLRTKVMITGCELTLWNCRVRGGTFPKKTSPMDPKSTGGLRQPRANFTSWQELLVSDGQGERQPLVKPGSPELTSPANPTQSSIHDEEYRKYIANFSSFLDGVVFYGAWGFKAGVGICRVHLVYSSACVYTFPPMRVRFFPQPSFCLNVSVLLFDDLGLC